MRVISKEEFLLDKERIMGEIERGAIFIYPTDTIYGLGCNALLPKSVKKLRGIKGRNKKPFSVIVPSREWVLENCYYTKQSIDWMKKLPGPYTLIYKLKNRKAVAEEVNPDIDSIGVRIPKHWFSEVSKGLNIPIITTSANTDGEDFMTSLDNLSSEIKSEIDFIIYEGEKLGKPSKVVNLSKGKIDILRK